MIYVLDTDILSLLGHGDSPESPRIRRRIAELPQEHAVVTTIINYEEQMRGWMGALKKAGSVQSEVKVYTRLMSHLATFRKITVLGFDEAAASVFEQVKKQKTTIGPMDLKIAAIVLASKGILVTRNTGDFQKIAGLRIEDWSREIVD
jgi:tRNA(fMet)-specific endonuclease VapC